LARRSRRKNPEALRSELVKLLNDFESKLREENLRDQVKALVPANHVLRDLGSSLVDEEGVNSARDRILAYFKKYPLVLLHGDELMVVAGISEYARRIRELRVEFGWAILSGSTLRDVDVDLTSEQVEEAKTDTYYLASIEQDRDSALRWNIANTIRKDASSVKDKILRYLRENVGKKVTGEELIYLANGKSEWARRIRELRTEEGWPVMTRASGRPDLDVGVYMLEEDRQAEVHDRRIPDPVRIEVLERDSFSCKFCGWNIANRNHADRIRNLLELHHIDHHADGGKNIVSNLITLCNVCHDDVHRGKCTPQQLFALIKS